jgi:hypothetical protein
MINIDFLGHFVLHAFCSTRGLRNFYTKSREVEAKASVQPDRRLPQLGEKRTSPPSGSSCNFSVMWTGILNFASIF